MTKSKKQCCFFTSLSTEITSLSLVEQIKGTSCWDVQPAAQDSVIFQSLPSPPQRRLPEEIRLVIRRCRCCARLKCLVVDNKWRRGPSLNEATSGFSCRSASPSPRPHFLLVAKQPKWVRLVGFKPQNRVRLVGEHSIGSLQSLAPLWTVQPARATESRSEQRCTRGSPTTKGRDGRARMESWSVGGSVKTKTTWGSLHNEDYTLCVTSHHANRRVF